MASELSQLIEDELKKAENGGAGPDKHQKHLTSLRVKSTRAANGEPEGRLAQLAGAARRSCSGRLRLLGMGSVFGLLLVLLVVTLARGRGRSEVPAGYSKTSFEQPLGAQQAVPTASQPQSDLQTAAETASTGSQQDEDGSWGAGEQQQDEDASWDAGEQQQAAEEPQAAEGGSIDEFGQQRDQDGLAATSAAGAASGSSAAGKPSIDEELAQAIEQSLTEKAVRQDMAARTANEEGWAAERQSLHSTTDPEG